MTGDWAGRYATMDFFAEAAIAGEIGKFLLNGALYRGLRPVMWSVVEKTALAEAEIEYHDHTSDTVWVRFPILTGPLTGTSVVIWTTTPWTMPGNRALAAGAEIEYAQVRVDSVEEGSLAQPGETLLVALALLPQVCDAVGIATHHVLQVLPGTALEGVVCAHPLRGQGYDHDAPILLGDFVTTEQGSGLVHQAPAHGEEDFALCRANGIEVPETVGEAGLYNPWVPLFAGIHVFKAAKPVSDAIEAAGGLLGRGKLVHSYPHSWRSKAPLIYRATPQWFIRMDGPERIRERALEAIDQTVFVPPQGRNRIGSMVAGRPDWCVSRQRAWGVPIPVFVHRATGEALRDPAVCRPRGRGLHRRGRRRLVCLAAGALPRPGSRPGRVRAGDGHRRRVVRERLDPRLRAGGSRPALARGSVSGRLGPASRLVPVEPAGGGRHPRRGAVQGGGDAWLRARRDRAEDE